MQQWYQCPKCSAPVSFGTRFCSRCGTQINWPAQQQQAQPPPTYQQQQPGQRGQQPAQSGGYQQQADYRQVGEKPERKKTSAWLIGCLGVIGFVILVGGIIFFSNMGSQGTPSSNPPSSTQPQPVPTGEKVYSVDQDVIVGKGRWKVLSATDKGSVLLGSESEYPTITADKTTTGKFIKVSFELENMGTITETWVPSPTVVDSKGREFKSGDGVWSWIPDEKSFTLTSIHPGVPMQFIEIYEVSKDSSALKLKVEDISFGGSATALISLGF